MSSLLRRYVCVGLAGAIAAGVAVGQVPKPKSSRPVVAADKVESDPVLERALRVWPDAVVDTVKRPGEWTYEEGVLLDGMLAEWRVTGDGRLFAYVKAAIDRSVEKDGTVLFSEKAPFPVKEHTLDNIEMGRATLTVYRVTEDPRYYKAVKFLHDQMKVQPKNSAGGYWHKQIYPNQMWLDGAYMAEPFMEGYGKTFNDQKGMDEAVAQLLLMDQRMRDHKTGLMHHGWDPSLKMAWADKESGLSPEIWGRAMGWYAMAVVDVLERMPAADPQRLALEDVADRLLATVAHYQDPASGLWWQVMDKGGQPGNYLEASASCMFVYAMAKGVRLGVAPMTLEPAVLKGWAGIQKKFVKPDGTLSGTVKVAGLGGTPYRSGTYEYYTGEEVGDNDAKGVGSYLMALSEVTQIHRDGELLRKARGKTVLVDAWFNSQTHKLPEGGSQLFHYKWNDDANSGYSAWAHMFQQYGMRTEMLDHAPRAEDLKDVKIYVIASPEPALNPNTHTMDEASAKAIEAWVKAGGVLVLMENDPAHADQAHFDMLSESFGIHFNAVDVNAEVGDDYSTTIVPIAAGMGGIFHHAHRALMKDTCTIVASGAARPILTVHGDTFMSVAHVGRGLVYANADPWLYNEYTDGRKAPLGEDNFAAGLELTRWLVGQAVAR